MIKSIPFTKQGFEELQNKLKQFQSDRPHAVAELKRAREMGDLSENGAYKGARFKLSHIDREIRHLEGILKKAFIVEKKNSSSVDIGNSVSLLHNNETVTYAIVGGFESNPLEHKISQKSPLGSALIGKRVGEEIEIHTPTGKRTYKILEIS